MRNPSFIIRDNKASAYLEPWSAQTVATGLRVWQENCQNPKSMFARHPDDFTLFERGHENTDTGDFEPYKNGHISHGTARQIIAQARRIEEAAERETEIEPAHFPTNPADIQQAIIKSVKEANS